MNNKFKYEISGPATMLVIDPSELTVDQKKALTIATQNYVYGQHYFHIPRNAAIKWRMKKENVPGFRKPVKP